MMSEHLDGAASSSSSSTSSTSVLEKWEKEEAAAAAAAESHGHNRGADHRDSLNASIAAGPLANFIQNTLCCNKMFSRAACVFERFTDGTGAGHLRRNLCAEKT